MRVRLMFANTGGEFPEVAAVVDEYVEEGWGDIPSWYQAERMKYTNTRDVIVDIPDALVQGLFKPVTVAVDVIDVVQ